MKEDILLNYIEKIMRKTFQKSNKEFSIDYFKPQSIEVSDWSRNPLFLGARSINIKKALYQDLSSNVDNLFFAGDAYNTTISGTYEAASISG